MPYDAMSRSWVFINYKAKPMQIPRTRALGLLAALASVIIWAAFMLSTRFAVKGNFTVEEVLILRLLPAALIMAPAMLKLGIIPHGQPWYRATMLMIGASAVTPYLISKGLSYAPASDGGALAPGMLPFWTALAAYVMAGELPSQRRRLGLAMILVGAVLVSLWEALAGASDSAWKGHLMFLTGSGVWAVYSVMFRQSGLSPMHGLVIGLFWGALVFTPILLFTGSISFSDTNFSEIMIMIVLQSFVIGILAMVLFNYAVQFLGAAETAAFGALTPILALVGGMIILGEAVTPLKFGGVILVASGVFLASGFLNKSRSTL
tara:strand:+ start:933 stop:1892 length:960 start_codon:yes stop_codon:yes gene_type:complete